MSARTNSILFRFFENYKQGGLFSKSFITLSSTFITNIIRFILTIVIIKFYTKESFGLWATLTSVTAILATGDFGFGNALRNKLSELIVINTEESDQTARRFFLGAFFFFFFFATLLSIIIFIFQENIPSDWLFKTDNSNYREAGRVMIVYVQIILLITIPFSMCNACFFSYGESNVLALINVFQGLISLISIVILSVLNASIVSVAIMTFLVILISNIFGTVYFLRKRRWNLSEPSFIRKLPSTLKFMFKKGMPFFFLQTGSAFVFNIGTILISSKLGLSFASEYNIIQKLYVFCISIYQSLFNNLWAGYAQAYIKKEYEWCRNTLIKTNLITVILFSIGTGFFYYFGNFIISLIANKQYISSQLFYLTLGCWSILYLLWAGTSVFQQAIGRLKITLYSTIICAFAGMILIKYLHIKFSILTASLIPSIFYVFMILPVIAEAYYILKKKNNILV